MSDGATNGDDGCRL